MDLFIIPLLFLVIFVFGWCIIGFALLTELLLNVSDKYFENKNILLVTAHPDDECMFFSPLLSYLSHKHFCDATHILALSNGGSDLRSKELRFAAQKVFGIGKKHIGIINDEENLRDDMEEYWNNDIIIKYVNECIERNKIDIIVTFDEYGISGHPNHISIYNALQKAINQQLLSLNSDTTIIDVYSLKSTSIVRKHCAWFEAMLWLIIFVPLNLNINQSDFVILSAPNKCWEAMTHHSSQFVWFRKLSVVFSRYGWINQFHQILPQNQQTQKSNENKKRR